MPPPGLAQAPPKAVSLLLAPAALRVLAQKAEARQSVGPRVASALRAQPDWRAVGLTFPRTERRGRRPKPGPPPRRALGPLPNTIARALAGEPPLVPLKV